MDCLLAESIHQEVCITSIIEELNKYKILTVRNCNTPLPISLLFYCTLILSLSLPREQASLLLNSLLYQSCASLNFVNFQSRFKHFTRSVFFI